MLPLGYNVLALRTATAPPARHTNCHVVGFKDALVVDPGTPFPAELDRLTALLYQLRGRGGTMAAVFLTHHHRDHICGALAVATRLGLPILAHDQTLRRLGALGRARAVLLRRVHDGETLRVDGTREISVLHTPGHAAGHCCLFEQRASVLLAGDMISGLGSILIDPAEGDMASYMQSLRQLEVLAPKWILPAHGAAIAHGQRALQDLLMRRIQREEKIVTCLQRLVSAESHAVDGTRWQGTAAQNGTASTLAVARCSYDDMPKSVLSSLLALRSTLAHLLKLEAEGRIRRSGDHRWQAAGSNP